MARDYSLESSKTGPTRINRDHGTFAVAIMILYVWDGEGQNSQKRTELSQFLVNITKSNVTGVGRRVAKIDTLMVERFYSLESVKQPQQGEIEMTALSRSRL